METTINISLRYRKLLTELAKSVGIPRSWLVRNLIQGAMQERAGNAAGFVPVRYQERTMPGVRSAMSVCLNERDYEWVTDARKFLKESVSFIVVWAIEKYLILKRKPGKRHAIKKFTHNYRFTNYILAFQDTQSAFCWMICWGKGGKTPPMATPTRLLIDQIP
ncbi:MAG: hypothetical protein EPN93_15650 [Spirochaetes bacterium]|nr:MAG: hypothetical protein EPN93_15650 [Spirochaetota bacterium]